MHIRDARTKESLEVKSLPLVTIGDNTDREVPESDILQSYSDYLPDLVPMRSESGDLVWQYIADEQGYQASTKELEADPDSIDLYLIDIYMTVHTLTHRRFT